MLREGIAASASYSQLIAHDFDPAIRQRQDKGSAARVLRTGHRGDGQSVLINLSRGSCGYQRRSMSIEQNSADTDHHQIVTSREPFDISITVREWTSMVMPTDYQNTYTNSVLSLAYRHLSFYFRGSGDFQSEGAANSQKLPNKLRRSPLPIALYLSESARKCE